MSLHSDAILCSKVSRPFGWGIKAIASAERRHLEAVTGGKEVCLVTSKAQEVIIGAFVDLRTIFGVESEQLDDHQLRL